MRIQVRARQNATKPIISVILLDWSVRESFHSLRYLNDQTFPRERTELIWVECYRHYPEPVRQSIEDPSHPAPLDQWIVLDRSPETYFHKHELYNAGILAARGEICIICDSDAIFARTFLYSVYLAMKSSPRRVIHVDEVRSESRKFYPFNNPTIDDVMRTPGLINWTGKTTTGLAATHDRLHELNYGACMAAWRRDLVAIGGADEHLDYLGYICGPHELTFRLVNHGHREHWLTDEWLYHVWHPGVAGVGNYGGPHDGRNFSTRTLALQQDGRVLPWVENPVMRLLREGGGPSPTALLEQLGAMDRRQWRDPENSLLMIDPAELIESDVSGYNILRDGQRFVALAQSEGAFLRDKLAARAYKHAFVAMSFDEARRAVMAGPSSEAHISRVPQALIAERQPQSPASSSAAAPIAPTVAARPKSRGKRKRPARSPAQAHGRSRQTRGGPEAVRLQLRGRLASDLGWAFYRTGQLQRALASFEEAVGADGTNVSARRGRARVYVAVGRFGDALADFKVAVGALSKDRALRAKVLAERAWARYYLGESEEAVRDFSEALEDTRHAKGRVAPEILKGRCWALADLRRWPESMHDFKRFSQMSGRPASNSPLLRLVGLRLSATRGSLSRLKRRARARLSGPRPRASAALATTSLPGGRD